MKYMFAIVAVIQICIWMMLATLLISVILIHIWNPDAITYEKDYSIEVVLYFIWTNQLYNTWIKEPQKMNYD